MCHKPSFPALGEPCPADDASRGTACARPDRLNAYTIVAPTDHRHRVVEYIERAHMDQQMAFVASEQISRYSSDRQMRVNAEKDRGGSFSECGVCGVKEVNNAAVANSPPIDNCLPGRGFVVVASAAAHDFFFISPPADNAIAVLRTAAVVHLHDIGRHHRGRHENKMTKTLGAYGVGFCAFMISAYGIWRRIDDGRFVAVTILAVMLN